MISWPEVRLGISSPVCPLPRVFSSRYGPTYWKNSEACPSRLRMRSPRGSDMLPPAGGVASLTTVMLCAAPAPRDRSGPLQRRHKRQPLRQSEQTEVCRTGALLQQALPPAEWPAASVAMRQMRTIAEWCSFSHPGVLSSSATVSKTAAQSQNAAHATVPPTVHSPPCFHHK